MICKKCGYRYAPFPKEDFDFIEKHDAIYGKVVDIVPKNENAEKKRKEVFQSDEYSICDACLKDMEEDARLHIVSIGEFAGGLYNA